MEWNALDPFLHAAEQFYRNLILIKRPFASQRKVVFRANVCFAALMRSNYLRKSRLAVPERGILT